MARYLFYGLVAFLIALVDLIPVLGAGIVLVPWSILALLTGYTKLALILIVLFIIIFLINQILEPLLLGKSIGLKPIYTLLITIISMIILGPVVGAIVGSIIAVLISVVMDVSKSKSLRDKVEKEAKTGKSREDKKEVYMDIDYEIIDEEEND